MTEPSMTTVTGRATTAPDTTADVSTNTTDDTTPKQSPDDLAVAALVVAYGLSADDAGHALNYIRYIDDWVARYPGEWVHLTRDQLEDPYYWVFDAVFPHGAVIADPGSPRAAVETALYGDVTDGLFVLVHDVEERDGELFCRAKARRAGASLN